MNQEQACVQMNQEQANVMWLTSYLKQISKLFDQKENAVHYAVIKLFSFSHQDFPLNYGIKVDKYICHIAFLFQLIFDVVADDSINQKILKTISVVRGLVTFLLWHQKC